MGFEIDEGGRIYAKIRGDNGIENEFIDQLRIVDIERNDLLQPLNGQYFAFDGQIPTDDTDTRVMQGRLENSKRRPSYRISENDYPAASIRCGTKSPLSAIACGRRFFRNYSSRLSVFLSQ